MTTVPFSLRLDSSLKAQLEKEAEEHDRSVSYIAVKAIKNYLLGQEHKKRAIDEAIKRADKGVFISQETTGSWVDSWGSDNESATPKADIFPNN